MKYQTNEELGPFINHWGCFFCSILEKVEKTTGWTKHFSNENVVGIYNEGMKLGYITPEKWEGRNPVDGCFVLDAPAIFNMAAEMLDTPFRCSGYSGRVGAMGCFNFQNIINIGIDNTNVYFYRLQNEDNVLTCTSGSSTQIGHALQVEFIVPATPTNA